MQLQDILIYSDLESRQHLSCTVGRRIWRYQRGNQNP